MSAEVVVGIVGVAIALAAFGWGIFAWRHDRRQRAAEAAESIERERRMAAERSADEVVVFIERGSPLQDGLPTWNVRVENLGQQPISDVAVSYSIRAWKPLPRSEGQVGERFANGPWLGPHNLIFDLVRPKERCEQTVFWEGPVDEVSGPLLLGAKFKDYRSRRWTRGQDFGWRSVEEDEFRDFWPRVPPE